jgi:hypothetical protein
MIYIYGDSHGGHSFKLLQLPHENHSQPSITMFRIGRDNKIINFVAQQKENDVIVLAYGEVDCRCHIQRQINLGRQEDECIEELVANYIQTIQNIQKPNIILVGVIPPTRQVDYENVNGPIVSEFPFVGKDDDRVRFTNKVNLKLEEKAKQNQFIYFNAYDHYTNADGTLKHELSDTTVHLGDNSYFLNKFYELLQKTQDSREPDPLLDGPQQIPRHQPGNLVNPLRARLSVPKNLPQRGRGAQHVLGQMFQDRTVFSRQNFQNLRRGR